jgi:hypothetical protein
MASPNRALGAFSSYDTAPATVSKGLPSLLAMSRLFNALPTADAILVSTSAYVILVFAGPCSEGLVCLHFTESPGNSHSRRGRWHSFSSHTHALALRASWTVARTLHTHSPLP